nr:hypothetical protein [Tanacetum cinerariifolium]GEZ04112.1 hypothetical protein [Tanacetum cinerariifolium]
MKFENLEMSDNDSIDAYAAKLSGIASKSATFREVMSEHKLVKKFLTTLPRNFVHIVAALEQVLELKTTGFEDVVGRLKAYKERVKEEDKANDPQENFLYARTVYSNGNNDSSGGRGRDSYSRVPTLCFKCPKWNRNHEVNLNETQKKGVYHKEDMFFMMNHIQETIFLNEEKYSPPKRESNTDDEDDVCYFDNGASNHMTGITYSVGVVSRYMQSPRSSLDRAIKKILRYLKGTTSFGIQYKQGNDMRLVRYSGHNVDIDDGRGTTEHPFYLGTSPITWCLQKQTIMVLSSYKAEFMAATAAACQAIWLRKVLAKVTKNEQVIVEHLFRENQRADPLTKALARWDHYLVCKSYPLGLRNSRGDCWQILEV